MALVTALACSSASLLACGSDSESGSNGSGTGGSSAGTTGTSGTSGVGGEGSASSSGGGADSSGGAGGSAAEGCIAGLEGTWKIPGYEAYLRVAGDCRVTLFCDLVKGYHSTGYFEGDTVTLIDVATADVTLDGDTLTLLIPSESTDTIVFARQESEAVIPEAFLE